MVEEEKKKIYRNDNRDPYKEEIKISPPDSHKRKNINYFSHSKDPYFLYPPHGGQSYFLYILSYTKIHMAYPHTSILSKEKT
jgi:hypothetical protein